jgi:DNA-binding response OmpR family regulator
MGNEKILIVEDDADVRLGYQVLLNAHNYQTFFAADCSAALRELSTHLPDLIILDLGLPYLDGFDVLNEFDLYAFLAPVIVVSARDPHGNKERALKAGARAYVQKPWNDSELLAMINRLLVENEELTQQVVLVRPAETANEARRSQSGVSSTSRTLRASVRGVNGFCRNGVPSISTP